MDTPKLSRLSRLTAILIQFQTKKIITAFELSEKFQVSKRTIYRDIRSLEQSGVPILTEEGKGFTLMEGYKIPPVMFTENQVNALILAEQLVLQNKDASFVKDYSEAIDKIKSILRYSDKDKASLLTDRTQYTEVITLERNSNNLSGLQYALTNYKLVNIQYVNKEGKATSRTIEPFSILSAENWYMIAWCHLRQEFRFFRLDRIEKMEILTDNFEPHKLTLQAYFDKYH